VGTSYVESLDAVALAEKLNMWATIGQHPTDTFEEFDYDKYKALAANKCVVGIGECGLDYVQSKFSKLAVDDEKARQSALFIQQVALASELAKPLMIHCRPSPGTLDAYTDLLKLLTTTMIYHSGANPGTVHFFDGDWEIGKKFLDLGFSLSFNGVLTFASQYDEVLRNVPAESLLIETDAPYVAPVPYRGRRNEPAYVLEVAKRVGEIRGINGQESGELASANARRVFGLA